MRQRVGTTRGLAGFKRGTDEAEQVYVFVGETKERPVTVEGHQGWGIEEKHRLRLTKNQAAELAMLLVAALAETGAEPNMEGR